MQIFPKTLTLLSAMLASVLPASALAANGMYLTGYGTESVLMGGADVAVAMQTGTYDSPLFGPNASERCNSLTIHLSMSRRW